MRLNTDKFGSLRELLERRILVLDGAMGSRLLCGGGKRNSGMLPDVLVRDCPKEVIRIHEEYLEAGADIIETDSFNANPQSLADYGLGEDSYCLSKESAILARMAAEKYTSLTPGKPRFVAGSVGPANTMLSRSPDLQSAFACLTDAYEIQMKGLIEGGADIIMLETVVDPLNAVAGLKALSRLEKQTGYRIPAIVSATVDRDGRLPSGHDLEAFFSSLRHEGLLAAGINCGMGSAGMLSLSKRVYAAANVGVALYPNAGFPDDCGKYHETSDIFASNLRECIETGFVNIIGGCCGTTPAHIHKLNEMATRINRNKPGNDLPM